MNFLQGIVVRQNGSVPAKGSAPLFRQTEVRRQGERRLVRRTEWPVKGFTR
jgi:hypothetical protein